MCNQPDRVNIYFVRQHVSRTYAFGLFAKGDVKCKVKSCLKYCRLSTILPFQVEDIKKSILFSNLIITVICPFYMACKILASPTFYSLRNSLNSLNCRFCFVEFDIHANKVQLGNRKSWSGLVKTISTWILVQGHKVGMRQDQPDVNKGISS